MNSGQDDPRNRDDLMRAVLTIYTTSLALCLIIFFGIAPFIKFKIKPDESMGVVELILPLLTGYIGTILGYYFGSKTVK